VADCQIRHLPPDLAIRREHFWIYRDWQACRLVGTREGLSQWLALDNNPKLL